MTDKLKGGAPPTCSYVRARLLRGPDSTKRQISNASQGVKRVHVRRRQHWAIQQILAAPR